MIFADTSWNMAKPEVELISSGAKHILDFVEKAGQNPLVFEAMGRFLFYFPSFFMPKGLTILAEYQKNIGGTRLLAGTNTVFYLERILQQLLILNPNRSRISKDLRESSMILLNAMIEAGSSCAYFLRDHLLHARCNR